MIEWIKENSIAFTIAVILHLLFIGALLFNWEYDKPKQIVLKQGDVIQTTAVDANSFNAKIEQIEQQKKAEQQRKAAEARKKKALKEKKRREELKRKEEQKRKKAEAARKKEQQRKAALLKEKKLKEQKLKEKKLREKKLKEKKRKEAEKKAAEEKRKKELARKKADARKAEEKKRKEAEQKRIAEQKRKEEQRQKAEAEKKRQAELRRQQERERAERERLSRGTVNKYVALIAQKIERNWRQPLDAPRNLQCKIDIRLRSTGEVVSVKIAESSGNASFDRSVETAVRRASPLPVPKDSVIFKEFEVMRLRFEPGSH